MNLPNIKSLFDKPLNICMGCDFFYPCYGGVEIHIYQLSCMLMRLGHKVTILTHIYDDRVGERYMGNGIKVIYLQFRPLFMNLIMPNLSFSTMSTIRRILIEENINLIHIHQCTSILTHDLLHIGSLLNIPSVFTDHSLFDFREIGSIKITKVTRCIYNDVDQFISVSNINKDNLFHRVSCNDMSKFNIIPNCIDFNFFKPQNIIDPIDVIEEKDMFNFNKIPFNRSLINPYKINNKHFTLVAISRQTFRKGTDLLIETIPILFKIFPNMKVIIGGDGPKKYLLEQMVSVFQMEDRITLTGSLSHSQVREYLYKGDIFLNTSLTESFCIAILEAACTGLVVVSTNIGGVEEVLPDYMNYLVEADKESILNGIIHSVEHLDTLKKQTSMYYNHLKNYYNWHKAIERVENVYDKAIHSDKSFKMRLDSYLKIGKFSPIFMILFIMVHLLMFIILSIISPKSNIKKKKTFDREKYLNYIRSLDN